MKLHFLLLIALLPTPGCLFAPAPAAKATIKVVDEVGQPVEGANVGLRLGVGLAGRSPTVRGVSDSHGLFTGELSGHGPLAYAASKQGYYAFGGPIFTKEVRHGLSRRWEPWNPTVIATLRPILNPVPMYVRTITTHLPALGTPCGFDLITSDWVAPWGKGGQAHIVFEGRREYTDWDNWSAWLRATFVGESSGYVMHTEELSNSGSSYKLPRFAPESGYVRVFEATHTPDAKIVHPVRDHLLFRTLTTENQKGETISALYGKTLGPIAFYPRNSTTLSLYFTYYLNPDGTRNLEFDPKRNLLKDRKDIFDYERPTAP